MYVSVYMCVRLYVYVCMYVSVYMCVRLYRYVCECLYVCTFI